MENLNKSRILFLLFIFLIIITPLAISRYFNNASDLLKSSVIMITGSLYISVFIILFTVNLFKSKNDITVSFIAPGLDISVLAFLLAIIISAIFSLKPKVSFWGQYERQVGLITYIYLTAIYFISGAVLNQAQNRKKALIFMELVAVIISLYAIIQFFQIDPFGLQPLAQRTVSTIGNAVFVGGFLVLVFPFSVLNASEKTSFSLRILFPLIIIFGIIVSGTRSAYLALLAQLIVILIFKNRIIAKIFKEKKIIFIILSSIFAVCVFLFLFLFNEGVLFRRITDALTFNNPRFILWRDAINIFYKYPVTGPGVAMFPAAFEEFYSNTLRFTEAKVVYDNAHNNFLQMLLTAGLAGFIAYTYLLYCAFKSSIKIIKNIPGDNTGKALSQSLFVMLTGYVFYGFTNFDDISILFYFFIYLSILRSLLIEKRVIKYSLFLKFVVPVPAVVLLILCLLNISLTRNHLAADRYFNQANLSYNEGDFINALHYNNEAINLNPGCSAYRYYEAVQVYNYCFDNYRLNIEAKQDLLKQVKAEINKVKENYYYINYCNGLLSLVYYEEGRIEEAEKLNKEVLEKDSINVNYRIKLARYLLKENRLEEAYRNLKVILLIKPDQTASKLLAAVYYSKAGDKLNAIKFSNEILLSDPNNKIALDIIKGYDEKK